MPFKKNSIFFQKKGIECLNLIPNIVYIRKIFILIEKRNVYGK